MKRRIRIGSRASKLAVWQANYVASGIMKFHPEIETEIVTMTTTGDKLQEESIDRAGGKGLFVKELDCALLEGRTDISVHSLKDMPMDPPKQLPILAYSEREDPREVLILRQNIEESHMQIIGTSSSRREAQMREIFPACSFVGIRGNVQTRLKKLEAGMYDATVLALAGLRRLGMEWVASRIFNTEEIIPAAGQGILAIQGREGDDTDYLDCLQSWESMVAATAERAFVRELNGGCMEPTAAYAKLLNGHVLIWGYYCTQDLKRSVRGQIDAPICDAERAGIELAKRLSGQL